MFILLRFYKFPLNAYLKKILKNKHQKNCKKKVQKKIAKKEQKKGHKGLSNLNIIMIIM